MQIDVGFGDKVDPPPAELPFPILLPLDAPVMRAYPQQYVGHYNTGRLHSAIGYITPADMLAGRQAEIHATRNRKLDEARR